MHLSTLSRCLRPPGGGHGAVRAAALALLVTGALSSTALADTTVTIGGGFSPTTGKPESCDSTEFLFVINSISGPAPTSITAVFDTGPGTPTFSVSVPRTFLNPPGSTAHFSLAIDASNKMDVLSTATVIVPTGTTIGNFVLSHGSCAPFTTTTPPPPPPGGTPELDTLALFAAGALGVAGYAINRRRASRRAA